MAEQTFNPQDYQPQPYQQPYQPQTIIPASQSIQKDSEDMKLLADFSKIFLQYDEILLLLRREFRGESKFIDKTGQEYWVQTTKPAFIKLDENRNPIMRDNPFIKDGLLPKKDYIPNDEAIDELIKMFRLCGINKITLITSLQMNEILTDLRSIACKLAATFALKQIEWGIDKELMPIQYEEIMTITKDARFIALNGNLLKTIRSSFQRIEQSIEQQKPSIKTPFS